MKLIQNAIRNILKTEINRQRPSMDTDSGFVVTRGDGGEER